jgi:predicted HicB family RNase H-like nuclease
MKIKEILELTYDKKTNLEKISAEKLPYGYKKVKAILLSIGAKTPPKGKKGWEYENVKETDLEKDITEFGGQVKSTEKNSNSRQFERISKTQEKNKSEKNNVINPEKHDIMEEETKQVKEVKQSKQPTNNPTNEEERKVVVKKVTYEIDEDLHYELRMKAFQQKKNVSELVEQALREYLNKGK